MTENELLAAVREAHVAAVEPPPGAMTIAQLAAALGLQRKAAMRAVAKLEAEGRVESCRIHQRDRMGRVCYAMAYVIKPARKR